MSRRIEPRSILKPAVSAQRGRAAARTAASIDMDVYWERLRKLIPGEVAALYVAGASVVPPDQSLGLAGWTVFCLIAVIIFFLRQTEDPAHGPDKIHVAISSISFLIWVYAIGGPFKAYGLHVGWLAFLIMSGWTFVVSPFLVPNAPRRQ
jgi:hypothetical protein